MIRKLISIVLLFLTFVAARFLIFWPSMFLDPEVGIRAQYFPEAVPTSEYVRLVVYGILILAVGVAGMVAAIALNRRWRAALGGIFLLVGGMFLIASLGRRMEAETLGFPWEAILWILLGVVLVFRQRRAERQAVRDS